MELKSPSDPHPLKHLSPVSLPYHHCPRDWFSQRRPPSVILPELQIRESMPPETGPPHQTASSSTHSSSVLWGSKDQGIPSPSGTISPLPTHEFQCGGGTRCLPNRHVLIYWLLVPGMDLVQRDWMVNEKDITSTPDGCPAAERPWEVIFQL
jgi:hypothetical protein